MFSEGSSAALPLFVLRVYLAHTGKTITTTATASAPTNNATSSWSDLVRSVSDRTRGIVRVCSTKS